MPSPRFVTTIALAAVSAVLLASCTSDDKAGDKSSPPASASAAGKSVAAAELARTLEAGIGPLKSAHFTVDSQVGGQPLTGTGDQQLDGGELTALAAQAALPGGLGQVELVVTGGKSYAKLPRGLANATKPWTLITADNPNVIVKQLASFVDAALTATSLGNLGDVVGATKSIRDVGAETVGATATTHYKIVVDPAGLPSAGLGDKPIPADLYLDKSGRPIKIRVALTVSGQATNTTIVFSKFDAPVSIQAPPASQIATN